ncbi:MAG TPA: DegQ family serine endoprotease [Verrucomicrobiae bacterium]|jgi:serine protease Do|nr:DegQ family serine endoprotease [Verrucomicrobiae bacterium]
MKLNQLSKQAAAMFLGGAVMLAAVAAVSTVHADEHALKSKSLGLTVDEHPLVRDARAGTSYAEVVKKVAPSVVRIEVSMEAKAQPEMQRFQGGLPDDPFFRRFFPNIPQQGDQGQKSYSPREHGVGSGVIVSKDGYILTNNHVVDDADQVKVILTDGREFTAKVVGKDSKSDIAVVKINAKDLPAIALANSSKTEIGDVVLAIGNPFGIGQSVTMGIVSATDRSAMGLDYENFIQTDAAINPGNSGGALVDTDGRLIGINTAIYSRSGGNQGVGFAIPTDLARSVMVSLIDYGKVTRGYLGVMIQDVNPSLAREFKLKDAKGALVGDVVPNGPADKAGLKSGDVVLEFDKTPVLDSRHLKLEVGAMAPGESVPLKVLRDGETKTFTVKLKELPGSEALAKADSDAPDKSDTLQGVAVADLDQQAREQFNVPTHLKGGAVVTQVDPNSPAAEAGLKPGDVITEINRHPVKGADDAVQLTEHAKEKTTLLHVWSGNGSHYLVVDESNKG